MAQLAFYEEIKHYEKLETDEERKAAAREIYDNYIMRELLSHTHVSHQWNIMCFSSRRSECQIINDPDRLYSRLRLRESAAVDVSESGVFSFRFQTYSLESVAHVQKNLMRNEVPVNLFQPYIEEIFNSLRGDLFNKFIESDKYTRYRQRSPPRRRLQGLGPRKQF